MNSYLPFAYHGCQFVCAAVPTGAGLYQPQVLYQFGLPGLEQIALPQDTEPYATDAEAMRHAEQQAVRWVHDRSAGGQGQF
ncbi:hypothetical protein [Rhodoferax sp.]|uniref:hypothetical protein n=1 Tax=Rhodoferax sp. TaxID=50421 RepID=UPI00374D2723